jgi:hypothetical protein
MIPENVQVLLSEDMAGVLGFCDTVSLSANEHVTQTPNTKGTHQETDLLSNFSGEDMLDVCPTQVGSSCHLTEPISTATKLFVFEFPEEFRRSDEIMGTSFTREQYCSLGNNDDDAVSDISESLSDDGTFSFVEEEMFPPYNNVGETQNVTIQDDWRRASFFTWASRYSMMEESQLLQGANVLMSLAR